MIRLFIRDQFPWILFTIVLLGWINLLLYLDVGLQSISALYLNTTSLFFLLSFVLFNYFRMARRLRKQGFTAFNADSIMSLYEQENDRVIDLSYQQQNENTVRFKEQADEQIRWIHEIKTPLTAQHLMIEAMPNNATKKQLELEWLRIHLLLDQTLHTLRIQSLEQDLILQQVDLRQVVIKEIKALQSWFMAHDLEIEVDNLQHTVHSDSKWLGFIIRQFLSNAIKYSDAGSTITLSSNMAKNRHYYLEIVDMGHGIASQDLPRIFQRGFTGKYGRQQSASTGMGLYLAKSIADKLLIQIQVDSQVEKGTTVRLYFPQPNTLDKIHESDENVTLEL